METIQSQFKRIRFNSKSFDDVLGGSTRESDVPIRQRSHARLPARNPSRNTRLSH